MAAGLVYFKNMRYKITRRGQRVREQEEAKREEMHRWKEERRRWDCIARLSGGNLPDKLERETITGETEG